jgi:hypothetical protein
MTDKHPRSDQFPFEVLPGVTLVAIDLPDGIELLLQENGPDEREHLSISFRQRLATADQALMRLPVVVVEVNVILGV